MILKKKEEMESEAVLIKGETIIIKRQKSGDNLLSPSWSKSNSSIIACRSSSSTTSPISLATRFRFRIEI